MGKSWGSFCGHSRPIDLSSVRPFSLTATCLLFREASGLAKRADWEIDTGEAGRFLLLDVGSGVRSFRVSSCICNLASADFGLS